LSLPEYQLRYFSEKNSQFGVIFVTENETYYNEAL
jgi:hypothetical protein